MGMHNVSPRVTFDCGDRLVAISALEVRSVTGHRAGHQRPSPSSALDTPDASDQGVSRTDRACWNLFAPTNEQACVSSRQLGSSRSMSRARCPGRSSDHWRQLDVSGPRGPLRQPLRRGGEGAFPRWRGWVDLIRAMSSATRFAPRGQCCPERFNPLAGRRC